ncbi:MAG TPA: VacJ family lipoprotein [Xanthomonadales bacterium]|nr:VacJ family lipoprotein [Xanthomonadales bacterium]
MNSSFPVIADTKTGGNSGAALLIRCCLLLLLFLLGGCAAKNATLTDPEVDPWEPFNREVHAFNEGFDRAIFRPVATAYDKAMPDAPQRGVRNFFRNLSYPVNFLNLLAQGKFEQSIIMTGRFLMNSTVGLLGFFDVASKSGVPDYQEDLGQTLAVWGWKDSRYLVMPFLGPFTVRDLGGRGIVSYMDPVAYVIREENLYWPLVLDLVSVRAELLPFQPDIDNASDPYAFVRDVYLQNREFNIYDGEPPEPDYDALLDE